MKKFWIVLGASFLGFGFYNLLFRSTESFLTKDFLIPIIKLRYSQVSTPTASLIEIGIGFLLIIIGIIRMSKD